MSSASFAAEGSRPLLVFFRTHTSGRCRRVESFVAQVLQRRRNHDTFKVLPVDAQKHPDVLERFGVEKTPTLVVVHEGRVHCRLAEPKTCAEITEFLSPWLR